MMEGEVREQGYLSQNVITQAFQDPEMRKAIIQFEFKLMQLYAHKLGIIALPNEANMNEWHGLISVPAGLYAPGKFKFILTFPMHFPLHRPKIRFLNPLLHPLVNAQGEVDVEKLIPDWKYGQDCMLYNLLSRFADLFLDVQFFETRDSLNPEAADLYRSNIKQYLQRIAEQIAISKEGLYERDQNFNLTFTKPNNDIANLLVKVEEINEKKTLSFQEKKRLLLQHVFQIKNDQN